MKTEAKILICGAALLALGWALRFEVIKPGGDVTFFYKLNRWTGTVYVCHRTGCREAEPQPVQQ